jgi:hypothetical protein
MRVVARGDYLAICDAISVATVFAAAVSSLIDAV